jgi:hypothetical protein
LYIINFTAQLIVVVQTQCLEDTEHLLDVEGLVDSREVLNDIEANSLSQRSALADSHNVTFRDVLESRRNVDSNVLVLLGETSVLREVLKIITAHNNSSLHLVGDDHSLQNSATDGDTAGKGALLVDVVSLNGGLWGLESKTDALVVSDTLFKQ